MRNEITEYLQTKAAEGRAKSTVYEYRLYLDAFTTHCSDKPLVEVTNADIVGWIAEEKKKDLAPASILARHRALKIFLRWCVDNDLLDKTPLRMKAPKVKRIDGNIADYADVQTLLKLLPDGWLDYRNRALVHALFDTGMRIGEALSLPVSNIDFGKRIIHIPAAKDGEDRHVPFTQACAVNLLEYLAKRPASKYDKWLFVGSLHGAVTGRFTVMGGRLMMHRFCKKAGVDYINPHSLRHLFATRALNAGMPVEIVSKILGHFSVDLTLRIYARLRTTTIQESYAKFWGGAA